MRKGRIRRTLLKAGVVGALTLALLAVPVPWTSLQLDEVSLARAAGPGGDAGTDAAKRGRFTPIALHSNALAGESDADRRLPQQNRPEQQAPRSDVSPAAQQSADSDRGSFESIGGLY